MGKRKRVLLAEQGILHLKRSFVQPTEESGLLATVGLEQDPLILASGSYGYGIPEAVAKKVMEDAEDRKNNADETDTDAAQIVREINGGVFSEGELNKDRSRGGTEAPFNDEEMTVAELVRSIGGGRDIPFKTSDVVMEDRPQGDEEGQKKEEENEEQMQQDPQADEFYASLGIQNPKEKEKEEKQSSKVDEGEPVPKDTSGDNTAGIKDFYKTFTQYYYSKDPDPYGDQRLDFGLPIASTTDEPTDAEGGREQTIIQLARMAQLRARQARAAADALEQAKKAKAIGTATVGEGEVVENEADIYDPLPMEVIPSSVVEELGITVDTPLEQYWEFVKEDPHDFNRWVCLIQYVEKKNNIFDLRRVYSAFLPIYSYCFGYWKRYAEIEKRFNYFGRALTILERGLEFIPLSVDLWISFIKLFAEINAHEPRLRKLVREQYEKALNTCGVEFRCDALWENYIHWETDNKKMRRVFCIYCRVLQVPTRLYNRHWDNFCCFLRESHPRVFLQKEEYEHMRKKGCRKFGFKYKEERELDDRDVRPTSKPEDQLMDYVKEKILSKMTKVHTKCEQETEKRWAYEDKIRRPYFHTKPLDKYQLRNWEEYLNFEISEGDHDRIVLLFERCLIACALYENFWCKYARYLENYYEKNSAHCDLSVHFLRKQKNVEIGTTKETEEEEKRMEDAHLTISGIISQLEKQEQEESKQVASVVDHIVNSVVLEELTQRQTVFKLLKPLIAQVVCDSDSKSDLSKLSSGFLDMAQCYDERVNTVGYIAATEELRRELLVSPKLNGDNDTTLVSNAPVKSGEQDPRSATTNFDKSSSDFSTLLSVPDFPPAKFAWQEAVRDVYKRASVVHCPKKPVIRLQWGAFEEQLGNSQEAVDLVKLVETWFPNFIEAKYFIIDIERRRGNLDEVSRLYEQYVKAVEKNRDEFSMFSLKYARFLHKELRQPDSALRVLRAAMKKNKANPRIYSYVYEICYEKYPDDKRAAYAALELAIACKEFNDKERLIFVKKKLLYLQEHGDVRRYRETLSQLIELQEIVRKTETEELRKKEEQRLRLAAQHSQEMSRFPVPDWTSVNQIQAKQMAVPIEFEPVVDSIVDNPSFETQVGRRIEENTESCREFEKVAPPEELNMDNYGYASKHPDYKLAEYMAHKEYEKLESKGYPENVKDNEDEGGSSMRKRKAEEKEGPIYIVQPKSATMYMSVPSTASETKSTLPGARGPEVIELEAPQRLSALAVPSDSPCINVPDWFVKDGGELCLSESKAGFSVLRYWPNFLNDLGQLKMFKSVRKSVKWHQKQRVVWSQWRYVPRLVSWLGPCEWVDRGLELSKNEDWPPEILDLLHRINQITQHEFNSCFLNLYRTGHDSHHWHADTLPAYGANPPVATISLGVMRLFEMRRRGPVHNFVRFPLCPGSLIIMEGACQVDWSHQIPKDPKVDGERISLVFRVMHAIEPVQKSDDSSKSRASSDIPMERDKASSSKEDTPAFKDGKQRVSEKENTGANESNQENQTKITFYNK